MSYAKWPILADLLPLFKLRGGFSKYRRSFEVNDTYYIRADDPCYN